MILRLIALLALLLTLAAPAQAGPLIGLLTGAAGFTGAITVAGIATTSLGFRLLATVAFSALSRALQPKSKSKEMPQGIRTQYPTAGGVTPQTFMLGYYASEGNRICPDYTFGSTGGTPNAYLVKIRDFGDVPGSTLGRVMINKQFVTLGAVAHPDHGFPVLDFREGTTDYAWVKYYDGSQIAADPFMLAQFGADPDYPWSADMVGTGICYAIFTFRYNRERFSGDPSLRCEFTGIPLYDPRLDTTVGGAGAHRWGNLATYQTTTNPQIMKYNILRGITLPDGSIWGGEAAATDVPLDVWFAAMNECDVVANGETAAQFQAGLEISVDQEPADIIDELDKACLGQTFEAGGVWKTRSGAPGLPVYFFTDDDVIITEEQELDPFPGLESTYNGVQATFPDPGSLWNPKEAPPRYNAAWEAEDQGRRLIANIQYNVVPYPDQVQRLMVASVNEERRFRRHTLVLPPDAAILEPLDVASWTSARNGYTSKSFEVSRSADDQVSFNQAIALREIDSSDYNWVSTSMLPTAAAATGRTYPVAQSVPGWAVAATTITDATATDRQPALQITWSATGIEDARALRWRVRVKATGVEISSGSTNDIESGGVIISSGILPNTDYEAQGRVVVDRPTTWTAWLTATTADIRLGYSDLVTQIVTDIANAAKVPVVATLPADDAAFGPVVMLTADENLYRWNSTALSWKASLNTGLLVGQLTAGQIGAGIIGATHMSSTTLSAIFAKIGTLSSANPGSDRVVISDALIQVIDGKGGAGATDIVRVKLGNLI